jgi:hypothetical protein
MTALIVSAHLSVPAIVAAAGERASMRFLEFFAAQIRNPHTRRVFRERRQPHRQLKRHHRPIRQQSAEAAE